MFSSNGSTLGICRYGGCAVDHPGCRHFTLYCRPVPHATIYCDFCCPVRYLERMEAPEDVVGYMERDRPMHSSTDGCFWHYVYVDTLVARAARFFFRKGSLALVSRCVFA